MPRLVHLGLAFCSGVALGALFPVPFGPSCAALILGVSALLVAALFRRSSIALTAAVALAAGWCRAPNRDDTTGLRSIVSPCARAVLARVDSASVRLSGRLVGKLAVEGMGPCQWAPAPPSLSPHRAELFLSISDPLAKPLVPGERVLLRGAVKPFTSHGNFFVPTFPEGDTERLFVAVESRDGLARVAGASPRLQGFLANVRESLSVFWSARLAAPLDGLARALVVGESRALDPGLRSRFARTGTAHLVAVSGLHLAILTFLCFGALRLLLLRASFLARRWDVGRAAAALTIPLLVGYALLVGGEPPVARSCVMASCVLLARAFGRRAASAEALFAAAIVLLAYDPTDIADPGFQLSFAAVAAFLVGARPRREEALDPLSLPRRDSFAARAVRSIRRRATSLFFASLAASAATTPIALYHFGQLSAIAVPCNMVAIPFVSALVMPALFGVSAVSLVSTGLASLGAPCVEALLAVLERGVTEASKAPFAAADAPGALLCAGALACSLTGLIYAARRTPKCLALFAVACAASVGAAIFEPPKIPKNALSVHILDVGQGSAALVGFPDGRRLLLDAGGSAHGPEAFGERLLVPALRALGVHALDLVALSHADPDHVVGARAVLSAFGPRRLFISGVGGEERARGSNEATFRETLEAARRAKIPIVAAPATCGAFVWAGVRVEIVHPCLPTAGRDPELSENDNSLVLRLVYGRTSVLLPGDLSAEGEARLLEAKLPLSADVLVLGHHGSDSSSAEPFLEAVNPKFAVASVGKDNRYGFPKRQIVEALRRRGVRLYRTDLHGAVRIVSDGASIAISTAGHE